MKLGAKTRFFSDLYDSVSQRAYPTFLGSRDARQAAFIGRLRLDSLLSRTVVLTDAQLLDGAFFIDVDKDHLVDSLKRDESDDALPIEVRSRCDQLNRALLGLVKGLQPRDTLVGFQFSSVADSAIRSELANRLAETPSSKVTRWNQIPGLLRKYGLDPTEAERLAKAWTELLNLGRRNVLHVVPWHGSPKLDLGEANDLRELLRSPQRCEDHIWRLWNQPTLRSTTFLQLDDWAPKDDDEAHDRWQIVRWYNAAYNQGLAEQHGCLSNYESIYQNLMPFDPMGKDLQVLMLRRDVPELEVRSKLCAELPAGVIEGLGRLESNHYRALIKNNGQYLETWWATGDTESLKRAISPFIDLAYSHRPHFDIRELGRVAVVPVPVRIGYRAMLALATGADPITSALSVLSVGAVGAAKGAAHYTIMYLYERYTAARKTQDICQRIIEIARKRTNYDDQD
jgi:hypothetical protein